MNEIIFVSIGGFLGAISRLAISRQVQSRNKTSFPAGTLTVNLTGAFLLGLLIGMELNRHLYALIGIGFMGAYTTFSTLNLESEQLKKSGKNKLYYSYIVSSYLIGFILIFCGLVIGRGI